MKSEKHALTRLIVAAVLLIVMLATGSATGFFSIKDLSEHLHFNGKTLWSVVLMILIVAAVESLIVLLLNLPKLQSHRAQSVLSVLSSLMRYVAFIVMICWGLSILGVNISTIIASLGILALIVGFSAESLISDVVTGTFMLFENQYNVGDIVEVDGFRGTVSKIGIRTTCLTDPGGNVKIINNSAMKNILNRSDNVSRSVSDIGIPYPTELAALEAELPALMKEIKAAHPEILKSEPKYLGVQELADSAVVLRFVADVDEKDIFAGARVLNHDLLLGFRRLGVECPFPQVDVHTDK